MQQLRDMPGADGALPMLRRLEIGGGGRPFTPAVDQLDPPGQILLQYLIALQREVLATRGHAQGAKLAHAAAIAARDSFLAVFAYLYPIRAPGTPAEDLPEPIRSVHVWGVYATRMADPAEVAAAQAGTALAPGPWGHCDAAM